VAKSKRKALIPPLFPSPALEPVPTTKFKKDVERQKQRGKDMSELRTVIDELRHRRRLPAKYNDHALGGDLKGWRDCHVEPDWVLIYKQDTKELTLGRTGTHSDLDLC
jgi:mRNA interferase YafQ